MNDTKGRRQRAIADLIRSGTLSNQEELAERLSALGFAATQATISRDLEQIGAVKVRRDDVRNSAGTRLAAVLRDFVRSIDTAGNLVVVKSPPGSAHMIGVALDQSDFREIVGTICGDDTIFVACRSSGEAAALSAKLSGELA